MIRLRQCIVVEGKYDRRKLLPLVDATVISTDGFRIFRDKEKLEMLRILAERDGIVILTDSDRAGFLIRNHLKGMIPVDRITHVYIPEILGKEKRKAAPSRDGLLGVEGMPDEILLRAFEQAGLLTETEERPSDKLTKLDLYQAGLSGSSGSAARREQLLARLELPRYLSANALLEILNRLMAPEEFRALTAELFETQETI